MTNPDPARTARVVRLPARVLAAVWRKVKARTPTRGPVCTDAALLSVALAKCDDDGACDVPVAGADAEILAGMLDEVAARAAKPTRAEAAAALAALRAGHSEAGASSPD